MGALFFYVSATSMNLLCHMRFFSVVLMMCMKIEKIAHSSVSIIHAFNSLMHEFAIKFTWTLAFLALGSTLLSKNLMHRLARNKTENCCAVPKCEPKWEIILWLFNPAFIKDKEFLFQFNTYDICMLAT